jgi:lipopolysaccharide export system protein LptC
MPKAERQAAMSPRVRRKSKRRRLKPTENRMWIDTESGPQRIRSRFYPRFVTVLKFVLPAAAITLVALVALWSHLWPSVDRLRVGSAMLRDLGDDEHAMIHARYVGVDRKGQPFSITAETVSYVDPDGNMMQLEAPEADITLTGGSWVAATADSGLYDRDGGSLKLTGAVDMFHDAGYQFRTSEAVIDLNTGEAEGSKPVQVQGPFGQLSAKGFKVIDEGRTVFFEGHAKMHIYPGALSSPRSQ